MRFYYKKKDGTAYFNLKTPVYDDNEDYEKMTEEEWQQHLEEIGDVESN